MIVGGGCRGRRLAAQLVGEGHAVRISTRSEAGRAAIEAAGAQCWIGTPDRLATLRGALDSVTVLCWMLASASGPARELAELHSTRLEFFLTQAIDTTVRGVVYEASRLDAADPVLTQAERIAVELTSRNAIPAVLVRAAPDDAAGWLLEAGDAVRVLLAGR